MRWLILTATVGFVAAATALIARSRVKSRPFDLGSVSQDWINDHRADHPH